MGEDEVTSPVARGGEVKAIGLNALAQFFGQAALVKLFGKPLDAADQRFERAARDQWVENIRLAWLDIRDFRGRAIELTGAKNCTVAACDLRNAEVGVYLGNDTHACRVDGCDITERRDIFAEARDYSEIS